MSKILPKGTKVAVAGKPGIGTIIKVHKDFEEYEIQLNKDKDPIFVPFRSVQPIKENEIKRMQELAGVVNEEIEEFPDIVGKTIKRAYQRRKLVTIVFTDGTAFEIGGGFSGVTASMKRQ